MANFTITISNQIYPLGPDVTTPSLWGTFQWGGKWLFSATDSIMAVEKVVTNAVTPDSTLSFETEKTVENSLAPDDANQVTKEIQKDLAETLSVSFDTSDEGLKNGDWNYVFVKPSANAENRNLATFTTSPNASTTWTSGTGAGTSWSE